MQCGRHRARGRAASKAAERNEERRLVCRLFCCVSRAIRGDCSERRDGDERCCAGLRALRLLRLAAHRALARRGPDVGARDARAPARASSRSRGSRRCSRAIRRAALGRVGGLRCEVLARLNRREALLARVAALPPDRMPRRSTSASSRPRAPRSRQDDRRRARALCRAAAVAARARRPPKRRPRASPSSKAISQSAAAKTRSAACCASSRTISRSTRAVAERFAEALLDLGLRRARRSTGCARDRQSTPGALAAPAAQRRRSRPRR